jgi:hypothetical protein
MTLVPSLHPAWTSEYIYLRCLILVPVKGLAVRIQVDDHGRSERCHATGEKGRMAGSTSGRRGRKTRRAEIIDIDLGHDKVARKLKKSAGNSESQPEIVNFRLAFWNSGQLFGFRATFAKAVRPTGGAVDTT